METAEYSKIYAAPIVTLERIGDYQPANGRRIVRADIGDGMTLMFLEDLGGKSGEPLTVTFHGARDPSVVKLPYFIRARSLREAQLPHLLFSDPTMSLDEANTRLTWYVGTPDVHVLEIIEGIVQKALDFLGNELVQFEGSSGGGFAALRIAPRFKKSSALSFSPQTSGFAYVNGAFSTRTIQLACGEQAPAPEYLDRFTLHSQYAGLSPSDMPLTRYIQNSEDQEHVRLQLLPFLNTLGIGASEPLTSVRQGPFEAILVDHGAGHRPPTPESWEAESSLLRRRLCERWPYEDAQIQDFPLHEEIPAANGYYRVRSAGSPATISYCVKAANGSGRRMRVFFHSAVRRTDDDIYSRFRHPQLADPDSVLDISVSDPTLELSPTLSVGWYVGADGHSVCGTIAAHLRILATRAGVEEVLLIGHSTGGFAAVLTAMDIPGSKVAVANPTISIDSHPGSATGTLSRSIGLSEEDFLAGPAYQDATNLIAARASRPDASLDSALVLLCESDQDYMRTQSPLLPLLNRAAFDPWLAVQPVSGGIPGGVELERLAHEHFSRPNSLNLKAPASPVDVIRFSIFGGCVSRDSYSMISAKGDAELLSYVARQSFLSIDHPASDSAVNADSLASAWQARRLRADLVGSGLREILAVADTTDIFLLDLNNERHGVYEFPDGGIVTNSYELALAGGISGEARLIRFGSDEHLFRWRSATNSVADALKQAGLFDKTIVLALPWAVKTPDGAASGASMGLEAPTANLLFEEYHRTLRDLGFTLFTGRDIEILADAENRWGLAPYHYSEGVYLEVARHILNTYHSQE